MHCTSKMCNEGNKQFKAATQGLSKDQKRLVHDMISGENYSYHEIVDLVRTLFKTRIFFIFPFKNEQEFMNYQLCGNIRCDA